MADKDIKEGDEGIEHVQCVLLYVDLSLIPPGGQAAEVATEGELKIESHRGNEIKNNAEPDNPAGNDVVKKASEVEVETPNEEARQENGTEPEGPKEKERTSEKHKEKDGAKKGNKRDAAQMNGEKKDAGHEKAKKQKIDEGDVKKSRGRPKKAENGANGKKKRAPKMAATESGEPRRSARHTKAT